MKRIIVIDDDPNVVYFIHEALSIKKFFVDFAFDGEEGFKKYLSDHFDLVIIDMQMPKCNGNDVAKKIRELNFNQSFLIGISGTPRKISEYYFDDIIHKPFRLKTLFDKVQILLKKEKGQQDFAFMSSKYEESNILLREIT